MRVCVCVVFLCLLACLSVRSFACLLVCWCDCLFDCLHVSWFLLTICFCVYECTCAITSSCNVGVVVFICLCVTRVFFFSSYPLMQILPDFVFYCFQCLSDLRVCVCVLPYELSLCRLFLISLYTLFWASWLSMRNCSRSSLFMSVLIYFAMSRLFCCLSFYIFPCPLLI